ncbi:MAG: hypothetical protein U5R48_11360 [Gammaproteobacteria bacterium]|nr:hypothetical protein [Gammaproteobacteria bacterium]
MDRLRGAQSAGAAEPAAWMRAAYLYYGASTDSLGDTDPNIS